MFVLRWAAGVRWLPTSDVLLHGGSAPDNAAGRTEQRWREIGVDTYVYVGCVVMGDVCCMYPLFCRCHGMI